MIFVHNGGLKNYKKVIALSKKIIHFNQENNFVYEIAWNHALWLGHKSIIPLHR